MVHARAVSERLFLRLDEDPVHGPESGAPAGTLRAFPVAAALRPYVAHVLSYREELAEGLEVRERVLPDGAVRLVFNLGDAPATDAGGDGLPLAALGASAAPVVVRLRRRVEGLSVMLRPGAAAALLGVPAGEIAGRAVDLAALWRGEAAALHERMAEAPDDAARAAALTEALVRRLAQGRTGGDDPHPALPHAMQLLAAPGGPRPLRAVAAEVGLGERRLQQLFQSQVGLAPRAWARLARLQACLRALRTQPAPAWAALAADGGFYDQSHLVNEFRALCGLTPTEFLRRTVSRSSKTPG